CRLNELMDALVAQQARDADHNARGFAGLTDGRVCTQIHPRAAHQYTLIRCYNPEAFQRVAIISILKDDPAVRVPKSQTIELRCRPPRDVKPLRWAGEQVAQTREGRYQCGNSGQTGSHAPVDYRLDGDGMHQ